MLVIRVSCLILLTRPTDFIVVLGLNYGGLVNWRFVMKLLLTLIFILGCSAVGYASVSNPIIKLLPANKYTSCQQQVTSKVPLSYKQYITLACVQLPVSCSSNSDCKCSGCCGSWDGGRGSGICQPSC